jgi:CreA protein
MSRFMLVVVLVVVAILTAVSSYAQSTPIGTVDTALKLFGKNHQVAVDRYDDPQVDGVSCYVSRAISGGITGSLGLAEDPSRFSIACRAVKDKLTLQDSVKKPGAQLVFSEKTSIFFKETRISRVFDAEKNVLVYLVWSTKLIDGSPFNSVTAVPVM